MNCHLIWISLHSTLSTNTHTFMIEKEIKILDINFTSLVKQLEELGAEKKSVCFIHDQYFDLPNKSLRKMWFRAKVRSYGTHKFELTIKERIKSKKTKNRIEKHIDLPNKESWPLLLATLWLVKKREKEKIRVSYSLDDVLFDIDFYDGIPPILEIEWPDAHTIFTWVKKLWLHNQSIKKRWTKKLFRHYNKKI